MKVSKLFVIGVLFFISVGMNAQVSVSVNIGSPPQWGPYGYSEARYYYIPDLEAYYDVQSSMFIYYGGGVWIRRSQLPGRFRYYDLYGGYKVVMTDYFGESPYDNFIMYKTKYAKGYGGHGQKTIGNRPGKGNSVSPVQYKKIPRNKVGQGNGKNSGSPANGNSGNGNHGHGGGHGKNK